MALRSAVVLEVLLMSLVLITYKVQSLKCYVDKIPRVETCNDTSTPQYCSCHLTNWTGPSFKSTGCSDLVYHNYDFSRGLDCVETGNHRLTYVRQCFCDEDLCCTQDTLNNAKNVKIGPSGPLDHSGASVTPMNVRVVLVMLAFKILSQVAV